MECRCVQEYKCERPKTHDDPRLRDGTPRCCDAGDAGARLAEASTDGDAVRARLPTEDGRPGEAELKGDVALGTRGNAAECGDGPGDCVRGTENDEDEWWARCAMDTDGDDPSMCTAGDADCDENSVDRRRLNCRSSSISVWARICKFCFSKVATFSRAKCSLRCSRRFSSRSC